MTNDEFAKKMVKVHAFECHAMAACAGKLETAEAQGAHTPA